jgi:hypothetical protein
LKILVVTSGAAPFAKVGGNRRDARQKILFSPVRPEIFQKYLTFKRKIVERSPQLWKKQQRLRYEDARQREIGEANGKCSG